MHVTIIGGGVAGLWTGLFLRRMGVEVTVLERSSIGSGASHGNAGWISPMQAGPLPEPGLIRYGAKSLFDRDSALYVAPAYLPHIMMWLVGFAARCRVAHHRRGTRQLAQLGARSFALNSALEDDGLRFGLRRQGMLVAAKSPETASAFLSRLRLMDGYGYHVPDRILDGHETREREPSLAASVQAGIEIEDLWHVDPSVLMDSLARHLLDLGVEIEERTEVVGLEYRDAEVHRLRTSSRSRTVDRIVIAAGAWSASLARHIGVRLPVQPGKGYSFEINVRGSALNRPTMLLEPHVAVTPYAGRVRVAGTMEFSGLNSRIDERRIASIVRTSAELLPLIGGSSPLRRWGGLRPIAPDGLPIVDRAPGFRNVYLATAYSMLGLTIAAPAAEALAKFIVLGRRDSELEPFRVTRFPWSRR